MSFFKAVTPTEEYCLYIEMVNGNTLLINLSSKLERQN